MKHNTATATLLSVCLCVCLLTQSIESVKVRARQAKAGNPCITTQNGFKYNLASFKNGGYGWNTTHTQGSQVQNYQFAICEALTASHCKPNSGSSVGACETIGANSMLLASAGPIWAPNPNAGQKGVLLTMTQGKKQTTCAAPNSVQILFKCDPTIKSKPEFKYLAYANCKWSFQVDHNIACPTGAVTPPPPPPPTNPPPPPPSPPPTPPPSPPPSPTTEPTTSSSEPPVTTAPPTTSSAPSPTTSEEPTTQPPTTQEPTSQPPPTTAPPPTTTSEAPPPTTSSEAPPPGTSSSSSTSSSTTAVETTAPTTTTPVTTAPPPPVCTGHTSCLECQSVVGCMWSELNVKCVEGTTLYNCSTSCSRFEYCVNCLAAPTVQNCAWDVAGKECRPHCTWCSVDCESLCRDANYDCTACQSSSDQCAWTPHGDHLCSAYDGESARRTCHDLGQTTSSKVVAGAIVTAVSLGSCCFVGIGIILCASARTAKLSSKPNIYRYLSFVLFGGAVGALACAVMAGLTDEWVVYGIEMSSGDHAAAHAHIGLTSVLYCPAKLGAGNSPPCVTKPFAYFNGTLSTYQTYGRTTAVLVGAGALLDVVFIGVFALMKSDMSGRALDGQCMPRLLILLMLLRTVAGGIAAVVFLLLPSAPHTAVSRHYSYSLFLHFGSIVLGTFGTVYASALTDRDSEVFMYTSF